jgi:ElaB/YqjD/DUF883 family membrane-anchored ribosome-binding protein
VIEPSDSAGSSDAIPRDVDAAEGADEAVRRAEEELEKARQAYRRVRRKAADRLKRIRETTAGDLIDGAMMLVKEYPGPSVVIALAMGFFLGRSFRR